LQTLATTTSANAVANVYRTIKVVIHASASQARKVASAIKVRQA
jgi:hypothetical protein